MRSATVLLLIVVLWAVGLMAFASRIDGSTPATDPPTADAVVALTGASDARLTQAVKLLEDGKARRMLISGVNPLATRAQVKDVSKATRRYYDCCIDLGFQAKNTVGNARETARWARRHGFTSLIVVTSDFHMPRAMLELKDAMPEATFTAYPIRSTDPDARRWWKSADGARRMITEYDKYLAILFRRGLIRLGIKAHQSGAPASAPPPAASSAADDGAKS